MSDTTELRRILGQTLQYVGGKIDVKDSGGTSGPAEELATTGDPVNVSEAAPRQQVRS